MAAISLYGLVQTVHSVADVQVPQFDEQSTHDPHEASATFPAGHSHFPLFKLNPAKHELVVPDGQSPAPQAHFEQVLPDNP